MATDISDLQARIEKFVDERDWDQFHNPKDLAISLTLEAAEVLEHFQWKTAEEVAAHVISHKEEVGEELADVLSWILMLAKNIDVDLMQIFEQKMQKNEAKYPIDKAKGSHKKYTELG